VKSPEEEGHTDNIRRRGEESKPATEPQGEKVAGGRVVSCSSKGNNVTPKGGGVK